MNNTKIIYYSITAVVVALLFWMGAATFSQPSVADLEGEFKEVASYRNENNTGPITRIYAVQAADTLWQEMEAYGAFMPHTKYGNTKVFFFAGEAPDEVVPTQPYFDRNYESNCMAVFEKSAMGEVKFKRYPFASR